MSSDVADFVDEKARREFWLFMIATFSSSLSGAALSLLSVALSRVGMEQVVIGLVLASAIVPVIAATVLSGPLIAAWGNYSVMLIGSLITFVGIVSFQVTIGSAWAASCSRIACAVGYGLYLPAAMMYAKNKLTERRMTYLFGIYSSMMPLATVVAPGLAEAYVVNVGLSGFFVIIALPMLVSLAILYQLRGGVDSRQPVKTVKYVALLRDRRLWAPNASALAVGILFGLVPSFLALILYERNMQVSLFFTPFAAVLFVSRLTFVAAAQKFSRHLVVAVALALMGSSYAILALARVPVGVVFAGMLYGFGHSLAYPVLSVWCATYFDPQDRAHPIALFNAVFGTGVYLTPLFGGIVMSHIGASGLLGVLSAMGLLMAAGLAVTTQRELRVTS